MEKEDLVQIMTENATAVGTIVHEISLVFDAIQYVLDLTKEKNLKTLACPGFGKKDQDMIYNLCKTQGLDVLKPPLREHADHIDTSLTWAEYGIAETGTVMVASDSEEIRIATMLAQIHIAMLPISKIKKDTKLIESYLDKILKSEAPSYTAFITGASRTADIERVLTIGVHGPVELHLLLLKEN